MTLYLLKVHLQTFFSIPITQKFQILSCDTLVANERYVTHIQHWSWCMCQLLQRTIYSTTTTGRNKYSW
jgi:hypothetical protein